MVVPPSLAAAFFPILAPNINNALLGRSRHSSPMRRLEQLDWIAVWIEDLDLPACRSGFHGVPECRSGAAQCLDDCGQVFHSKNDAV